MISKTLLTIANYSTLWDVGRTASSCSNRGAKQASQYSMPTVMQAVVLGNHNSPAADVNHKITHSSRGGRLDGDTDALLTVQSPSL
jgi:hypothetical protein